MLPNITGSEKQVKWASDIRDEAYETIDRMIRNYKRLEDQDPQYGQKFATSTLGYTPEDVEVVREFLTAILSQQIWSEARAIIDRRYELSQKKLEELAKAEHKDGAVSGFLANR